MSIRVVRVVRLVAVLAALPGCVFCPDLESAGYTACASDADCDVGRFCSEDLCAPPAWNDEAYSVRQHLVVENPSGSTLAAGTAIPVRVGRDGLLSLDDVGVDGRFTSYDPKTAAWRALPIFRDLEDDRYMAWIPLARALPAGARDTLAWLEARSDSGEPSQLEDPAGVLHAYASFSDGTLDGWFESSPGTDPPFVSAQGVANIADNQALVLQQALVPPVSVTFLARINGATCDEVFIGLVGDRESIFNDPPTAGLFVVEDLAASFQVGPVAESFAEAVGDPLRGPTAFARITVRVDAGAVSLSIDDEETGATSLRPPFADAPLYAAVQVGGACSVDLDAAWASPLPLPAPRVTAEPAVQLKLLF